MKFIKCLSYFLSLVLILSSFGMSAHAKKNKTMKYLAMDSNRDGVITQVEWRGNDQSFQNQDWNRDGILSGNEVRAGANKNGYDYNDSDRNNDNSFANLDYNRDNFISRTEWRGDRGSFDRIDCNGNSSLTRDEFLSRTECQATSSNATFRNLDNNNDGYLYKNEWRASTEAFVNKDCNRDNKVSRVEYFTQNCSSAICDFDCMFRELDVNNDGLIYRTEWRGNAQTFNQLDQNGNNSLTRSELSYANQTRQGKTQQVLGTVAEIIDSFFGQ